MSPTHLFMGTGFDLFWEKYLTWEGNVCWPGIVGPQLPGDNLSALSVFLIEISVRRLTSQLLCIRRAGTLVWPTNLIRLWFSQTHGILQCVESSVAPLEGRMTLDTDFWGSYLWVFKMCWAGQEEINLIFGEKTAETYQDSRKYWDQTLSGCVAYCMRTGWGSGRMKDFNLAFVHTVGHTAHVIYRGHRYIAQNSASSPSLTTSPLPSR